jgi:hypothetical protein
LNAAFCFKCGVFYFYEPGCIATIELSLRRPLVRFSLYELLYPGCSLLLLCIANLDHFFASSTFAAFIIFWIMNGAGLPAATSLLETT